MATTEESGSPEGKGDRSSADPDGKYPTRVLYCGGKGGCMSVFRRVTRKHLQIKGCNEMSVSNTINSTSLNSTEF